MSKHTPRHGLVSLDAENSDPQYSDSESKPHLNRLPPLSSPPVSKNAHYYSVLPKSGSPLLQLNSPRQTNARVTPSRDGGGQSWETKLKTNQVLRGKGLSKRTECKLVPSTPKKKKDTVLTSSPLSSDEKTPEIKVGTTPPKSSASDCKRKLQLGTTEVISLLDELDTENLNDDTEDVIITAIEDASKTRKKHFSPPNNRDPLQTSRYQELKMTPKLNKGSRRGTTPKCSVVVKPIVIRRQEATARQDKPNSDTELTQEWLPLCNSLKEDTKLPPPSVGNRVTQSVAAVHENGPCEPELESGPECHVQTPKEVATSTKKRKTRSSKSRKRDREEIENESTVAEVVLPAKAPNKTPQLPAKACKKTPLPPSKAPNKTPQLPAKACKKTPLPPSKASNKTPQLLAKACKKTPLPPSKASNKTPQLLAKACKKTPLPPPKTSNKTPLSVPRSVTRSVPRNYENALNNSLMSGDDDAIEPLSDSEVQSESEFESPVVRRKRRPLRNSANTPAEPFSVPRSVTRSVPRNYENALDNSLMSGDDDAIEPLSDSEVESESEFESPVVRRKRRPLRNSANTPAAKRQRLTTPRMKAKLGKKKGRKTVLVKKVRSVATPRRKDLVPRIPQKVVSFADDDDIDPFNIAREK